MDLLGYIEEHWTVIATVAGIIYSYAVLKIDIKEHDKRLSAVEDELKTISPIWIEIKERLVAIETTLKLISKSKE